MANLEVEASYADTRSVIAYTDLLNGRIDVEVRPYANNKDIWLRAWNIICCTALTQFTRKIPSVEGRKIYNNVLEICPQLESRIKEELKTRFPQAELGWYWDQQGEILEEENGQLILQEEVLV